MYSVVFYGKFREIYRVDREILDNIHKKYNGEFYLKKGIKDGYHISFNGIKYKKIAEDIQRLLSKMKGDYSYDIKEYHMKFKKIKDPNYTGRSYTNVIKIITDETVSNFQNIEQYKMYFENSVKMDTIFWKRYFKENELNFIYEIIKNEYIVQNSSEIFNSHLSHFWAYYSKLNAKQRKRLGELINRNSVSLVKEKVNSNIESSILTELRKKVKKMQLEKKVDFFSPKTYEEVVSGKFASREHENTLKNGKDYFNDTLKIANRWYLNIVYEKMILLNYNILDKYTINYLFGRNDKVFNYLKITF